MVGSWRWNVFLGVGGSVLTLLFSLDSNGMAVTSLRCLYASLTFFVLGFVFRALVALIMNPKAQALSQLDSDESKGSSVDYATPDQSDELNNLLKNQLNGNLPLEASEGAGFQPLTPPKLISTQNREPEELAKAIRHLTGG
ncbi:hypothetical protein [Paenibacillus sp. CF384]|uniref:hypothetical protein n=1 Tax=Paenibacillus sp. CF384 TaxID=1884382 RepID=UPI000894AF53|nr:hypothetical protein [Paenibacillus sp. CF384]SDW27069.1 hypothetical protein SAMN05518855_1001877 [Paenibacillus sp. CF384]